MISDIWQVARKFNSSNFISGQRESSTLPTSFLDISRLPKVFMWFSCWRAW